MASVRLVFGQRLAVVDIGRGLDQDEGNAAGLVGGVAPQVIGAALNDDAALADRRLAPSSSSSSISPSSTMP
jgi:hypothetical protein